MRVIFFLFLTILLASCCLGIPKCPENYNSARFRIIGSANGQDLVFGTSHIYDKDLIKFFSLNGVDTIFHYYRAGPNPNPGQDSLLYVNFDYRKKEIVLLC